MKNAETIVVVALRRRAPFLHSSFFILHLNFFL